MPRVTFHGRVLPENVLISVTPRAGNWRSEEWGTSIRIQPIIESSVVRVEVDVDIYEPERLLELMRRAEGFTHVVVDLIGFCSGRGLTV